MSVLDNYHILYIHLLIFCLFVFAPHKHLHMRITYQEGDDIPPQGGMMSSERMMSPPHFECAL